MPGYNEPSWRCPHCSQRYVFSDHPDVMDCGANSKTTFECDACGCTFSMFVDYDPVFTVDHGSVVRPK